MFTWPRAYLLNRNASAKGVCKGVVEAVRAFLEARWSLFEDGNVFARLLECLSMLKDYCRDCRDHKSVVEAVLLTVFKRGRSLRYSAQGFLHKSDLYVVMSNQRFFKIICFRFPTNVPQKIEHIRFWNKLYYRTKTFSLRFQNFRSKKDLVLSVSKFFLRLKNVLFWF